MYLCKALDQHGNLIIERVEAASIAAAEELLTRRNLTPIDIRPEGGASATVRAAFSAFFSRLTFRIGREDIVAFNRQLATIVSAGVPIVRALEICARQTENKHFSALLEVVSTDIRAGSSLAEALSKHPKVFSEIYTTMVSAGEAGGFLDQILLRLADMSEREAQVAYRIKSAVTYPIVVFCFIIGAALFIILWVVPAFGKTFGSIADLPRPTRVLLAVSNWMTHYGYFILLLVVAAAISVAPIYKTRWGRKFFDHVKLIAPLFGKIFEKSALSRVCRLLGTLIRSGVPILRSLELVSHASGNIHIQDAITEASGGVRRGESLSASLAAQPIFPPMVYQMVAVGEQSGSLDEFMLKVSDYYDMDVTYRIDALSSVLEPFLLVILGAMVLALALAVYLPLFGRLHQYIQRYG